MFAADFLLTSVSGLFMLFKCSVLRRFFCQLCYILIISSLSTISLCQLGYIGFQVSTYLKKTYFWNTILPANLIVKKRSWFLIFFDAHVFQIAKKISSLTHKKKIISGLYCAQNRTWLNLLVFTKNASNIYSLLDIQRHPHLNSRLAKTKYSVVWYLSDTVIFEVILDFI